MATENMQPVATVTGLYRGKFGGLEPLTASTPLSSEEVRRNPEVQAIYLGEGLLYDARHREGAPT